MNYDDQKLEAFFIANQAARRGTQFHELAANLIKMGVHLPKNKKTINQYVNDALGFFMQPEVVLFYSDICFGTADAIGFRKNKLRIHDLKMGITPTSMRQLKVYAALFCLEYTVKPMDIEIEIRIYQNDDVRVEDGNADEITHIMSKIVYFDQKLQAMRAEALA